MALSILLHENHDMMPLIVNSCKVDLDSRNSMFQALALSAIANLGGREMADALGATVIKLISGSTTKAFVVKRALLALLRLYRKSPDVAMHASLKPLLAQLVLSPDAGIQMAAASLLLGVAKDNVDEYESLRVPTADALHRMVVKKEFKKQYTFYGVPSPWLQVKLLRFHRHYPAPGVQAASLIDQSLKAIYASANDDSPASRGVNYRNARQAVLQEAIALVVQQRRKPELVRHTVTLLGSFLTAKTTNVRYLALDALVNVAIVGVERAALRRHADTIMKMLEDPDVSIRRRALDVLYCMCDEQLAKKIVSELLRYLIVADYNVREDLVVKIAILAERFATVYSWYVDVILQLISIAGDFVSDSIWHRVVQIVTNNEDIQEYAVAMAFEALHHPSCHETTVKVGGYLLGEFGHLLADNEGSSPEKQLQVLESKFGTVGDSTRGLLLTTFVKMANLYNELTPAGREGARGAQRRHVARAAEARLRVHGAARAGQRRADRQRARCDAAVSGARVQCGRGGREEKARGGAGPAARHGRRRRRRGGRRLRGRHCRRERSRRSGRVRGRQRRRQLGPPPRPRRRGARARRRRRLADAERGA
jgi:AP-2 complex subunit alpha